MARPVTIKKWGNSLAVRIPYYVAHQMGVREGDRVHMIVDHNVITISAPMTDKHMYMATIDTEHPDD